MLLFDLSAAPTFVYFWHSVGSAYFVRSLERGEREREGGRREGEGGRGRERQGGRKRRERGRREVSLGVRAW